MPIQENFQEKDAHSTIQFFYFYLLLLHHGHKPFSGMKLLIRFKPQYSKKGNQSGVKSRGFYAWLCIKLLCDFGLVLIFLASVSLSAEWSGGEGTLLCEELLNCLPNLQLPCHALKQAASQAASSEYFFISFFPNEFCDSLVFTFSKNLWVFFVMIKSNSLIFQTGHLLSFCFTIWPLAH